MQIHYPNTILKSIIKYYKKKIKNKSASTFGVGQRLVDKKKKRKQEKLRNPMKNIVVD